MQFFGYPFISHLQVEILFFKAIFCKGLSTYIDNKIADFLSLFKGIVLSNKNKAFLFVVEEHVNNISALVEDVVHRDLAKSELLLLLASFLRLLLLLL